MVKSCIKKLYKSFKREINVKFVTQYKTIKMSFFTNTKDKTPSLNQSPVAYKFTCPGCSCSYNSKTERTLHERTEEHVYPNKKSNEQSAIYEHLSICPHNSYIVDLFKVNNYEVNCNKFDINTIALDKADNWNEQLCNNIKIVKTLIIEGSFDV